MRKYLKLFALMTLPALAICDLTGCKKKEDIGISKERPEKPIDAFFGRDNSVDRPLIIHLYKDTVYTMSQYFDRRRGEQLIIDEGTLIKVGPSLNNYILIDTGAIIVANGTANNPIVFTSNASAGTQGPNWGGLIIKGKAPDNSLNPHGDPSDFSGSINYVRVEFAQLTLTGLGSQTLIQNTQVSYSSTNSFEIDGGTFNAQNLVSYACGGTADFYITRGYTGKMQNILAYRHPFFAPTGYTTTGIYLENNPDNPAATPNTLPIISNATVLGPDGQNGSAPSYGDTTKRSAALVTTKNASFHIRNSLFLGFPAACWYLDNAQTADAIRYDHAEVDYSIFHCNDSNRAFHLYPAVYPPFDNNDFKNFILAPPFHDQLLASSGDFMLQDPFNYEHPDPSPKENSPVLLGADFTGANFNNAFFNKVPQRGALGKDNWLQGWTNFTPVKTNYNFPK